MSLRAYRKKRNFSRTKEPRGALTRAAQAQRSFVVQKHAASRLHCDFRLELDGTLKSWAVPKGPSLDPRQKRLAVHVEDHPIEYGSFEGTIPKGQYGGGTVMLWDRGTWMPEGDPRAGYEKGNLKFQLFGERLLGRWALVRMRGRNGEGDKNWLLIKERDAAADANDSAALSDSDRSVVSGRTMSEIASGVSPAKRVGQRSGKKRQVIGGRPRAGTSAYGAARCPTR